jgi:hypothetical protein
MLGLGAAWAQLPQLNPGQILANDTASVGPARPAYSVGTSGHTIPFLDGVNRWSTTQTIGGPAALGTDALLTVNANTAAVPITDFPSTESIPFRINGPDNKVVGEVIYGYGAGGFPALGLFKARGTGASPSAVQSGDVLGVVDSHGYGTSGWFGGTPQLRFTASQNWTDTAQGTVIGFWTSANGTLAANVKEVARIDSTGFLGMGTTSPQAFLHLNGNTTQNVAAGTGTMALLSAADGQSANIQINSFGAATSQFSSIQFRQAAGTAASPTGVQAGAIFGIIGGSTYTSSGAYTNSNGQVRFIATQTQTAVNQGQAVAIIGTPDGTSSAVEVARFQNGVGVGTSTIPGFGIINALNDVQINGVSAITASSTKTLTNTTFDTAGTGNSFSVAGVALTANSGAGAMVRASGPSISSLTVTTGFTATGLVTNAALANMSTTTIKGQTVGGSGAPVDLTATQAAAIIGSVGGALKNKMITITRDLTVASGNVAYTGVGFQPTSCIAQGQVGAGATAFHGSLAQLHRQHNRARAICRRRLI